MATYEITKNIIKTRQFGTVQLWSHLYAMTLFFFVLMKQNQQQQQQDRHIHNNHYLYLQ